MRQLAKRLAARSVEKGNPAFIAQLPKRSDRQRGLLPFLTWPFYLWQALPIDAFSGKGPLAIAEEEDPSKRPSNESPPVGALEAIVALKPGLESDAESDETVFRQGVPIAAVALLGASIFADMPHRSPSNESGTHDAGGDGGAGASDLAFGSGSDTGDGPDFAAWDNSQSAEFANLGGETTNAPHPSLLELTLHANAGLAELGLTASFDVTHWFDQLEFNVDGYGGNIAVDTGLSPSSSVQQVIGFTFDNALDKLITSGSGLALSSGVDDQDSITSLDHDLAGSANAQLAQITGLQDLLGGDLTELLSSGGKLEYSVSSTAVDDSGSQILMNAAPSVGTLVTSSANFLDLHSTGDIGSGNSISFSPAPLVSDQIPTTGQYTEYSWTVPSINGSELNAVQYIETPSFLSAPMGSSVAAVDHHVDVTPGSATAHLDDLSLRNVHV